MEDRDDRYHIVDVQRRGEHERSSEQFDRIAFAMHALRMLSPAMTVAVYPRQRSIAVDRVRDRTRGPEAAWATLGVPPDASRAHIALAVAELAEHPHPRFALDLLVSGTREPAPQ